MTAAPETIVANATPPGRGGIGIVRVSGLATRAIAITMLGARIARPRHCAPTGGKRSARVADPSSLALREPGSLSSLAL